MSENSWPENDSCSMSNVKSPWPEDPELPQLSEVEIDYPEGEGRRRKAALMLALIWSCTIALHLFSVGFWAVCGLTTVISMHWLRMIRASALPTEEPLNLDKPETEYPFVSLLVSAKNEEAVLESLVKTLCKLDYPAERYEVWIVDDSSTDKTPDVLAQLSEEYAQLHVLRRSAEDGGGKSGALNQVLPMTQGDIIGVFDADAQVSADLLCRVLPLFDDPQMGAVQVRKQIANADTNFWTRGQSAEMGLDLYLQQQRIAVGGVGELRGNGQFVRRQALASCGGWNEATITDDLDLTFRLHLNHWDIGILPVPAVREEGVTRAIALWHQRNRWAEGGYQRYLDYWPLIIRNRLGPRKTFDLVVFWFAQYVLPTAAVPDLVMATARNQLPLLMPMTSVTMLLSLVGMWNGLDRIRKAEQIAPTPLVMFLQTVRGTLYTCHWFLVMACVTARMSIRPKRLKWVKTLRQDDYQIYVPD
ncbi:glycosyltransferase family 2 protein [Acaryochloris sp. CCMEE 5410]|nr:glycosyltransferase family 2 protein [Acaryochloris sp. CCMEE 5410]